MPIRLTEAQAKQLGLTAPKAPKPRKAPPSNGHQWQREGRGLRCQQCGMWEPLWALPAWGHGDWEKALTREPAPDNPFFDL